MKSLKKTLVLLVVLSMILSAVSPVFAFSDVTDQHYAEQANKMAAFGVFVGDNGNFNGDAEITRAEMAVIIGKLTGMDEGQAEANRYYASNFSDVKAGEWYTGWVNLVAGRGIISGFPDGRFGPTEKVTQAQAVTMIVKALGWGVVIDNQAGTWPANYIAKAAELKLFKNVESDGELVTRGNVAIYCYNALTAKTWDVTESTDGSLTSSSRDTETILAKYFSDFVNEDGEMKLVENAKVVATPINNNTIGKQQIVLAEDAETEYESGSDIAAFIDIEKPGKNKEEKTYEGANDTIVAYVLESASTELASLQGKYVDVIFGENNEVVYIAVTDDAENGLFVTAWDYAEDEIELNGTKYEVLEDAQVSLFGTYVIPTTTSYDAVEAIEDILCHSTTLAVTNTTKRFTRNVSASIVLDEDGDIKGIDFVASENFAELVPVALDEETVVYVGMQEAVVEKISNAGKVTTVNNASKINGVKLEDLEEDDVRVIKNNEIVSVEDIEVGNVLTLVIVDDSTTPPTNLTNAEIKTIFVSDAVVTGTLDKVKNNVLTIDGEEYNRVNDLNGNTDGDIKEIAPVEELVDEYLDEEVEVYLNFMGEVSVILSETESVPATIGVVTKIYDAEEDEDAEVEYLPVKILSAETGKATKYSIYNADSDESFDEETLANLAVGATVWFSADTNGVIEYDAEAEDSDILVVAKADLTGYDTTAEYKVDGKELTVVVLTDVEVDESRNEVTVASEDYIFDDATTTYYNVCQTEDVEGEIEIIKGWASLVTTDELHAINETDLILVDGDEVVFYVGNVETYAGTTAEYAILESIDTRKENGKTKTYVTLVDDDTEYEVADIEDEVEEGDLVQYSISNDKITVTEAVDTWTVTHTDDDEALEALETSVAYKGTLLVDRVDGRRVYYAEYEDEDEQDALYLVKTSVTVFDLEEGTVEVVDVEDLDEVVSGRYAVGTSADVDSNGNIDTIVLF